MLLIASLGFIAVGLWRAAETSSQAQLVAALESPTTFDAGATVAHAAPAAITTAYAPGTLAAPEVSLSVPLETTGRDDAGDLVIPKADKAGVFSESAPLSATTGSTFVAGHVVDRAGTFAPMAQLALLKAGDPVVTVDENGARHDWTVVSSAVVPRDGLTADMWRTDGDRRLVLVTCAGRIDEATGGMVSFEDNLVVTAVPR